MRTPLGNEAPVVKLVGTDGNVFALLGKCRSALKRAGLTEEVDALTKEVTSSKSYSEALGVMNRYVDVR